MSNNNKSSYPSNVFHGITIGLAIASGINVCAKLITYSRAKKKVESSPVIDFVDKIVAMNATSKQGFFCLYKNGLILDHNNQKISQEVLETKFKIKFTVTEDKEPAFTSPLVPDVIFRTTRFTKLNGLPLKKSVVTVPGLIVVLYAEDEYLCLSFDE